MSMRIGLVLALLLRVTPLAAQQATLPTWITSETLRIGAVDGADALSRVGYSTVSPDGRMVYVNQRSQNSIPGSSTG